MKDDDKAEFAALVRHTFKVYDKPTPDREILGMYWRALEPFALAAVQHAFGRHIAESEFCPRPASIRKLLTATAHDGRPASDEAWAVALTSRDEAATVVWTKETAEAFGIAVSVLDNGDEVGARMAFKEAYTRLVDEARTLGHPCEWVASLGWDTDGRVSALTKAVIQGRISDQRATNLLPSPIDVPLADAEAAALNRKRLDELLAIIPAHMENRALERQQERERLAQQKKDIAARVAAYGENHGA